MDYPLPEIPFILVPFEDMNKKQVEQYFQWFMDEKDKRLQQLELYINKNNTEKIVLDKRPGSLVSLWEWFEPHIKWEDRTEKEISDEAKGKPEWMREIIQQSTRKMTMLTMSLASDIATYFGETLIHNNPGIRWGYLLKPPKFIDVKRPVLLGFRNNITLNPIRIVHTCIFRSCEKRDKNQLYELYNKWLQSI